MQVIKRDGRSVEFNREKVKNAVLAAFKEVDKEVTQEAKNKAQMGNIYLIEFFIVV